MVVSWPARVNKNVYGAEHGWTENREEIQFKSGRRVYWLKNSEARKTFTVKMKFDDSAIVSGGKTEWELFCEWWETTLACGANAFEFVDIAKKGTGVKNYYITSKPEGTGLKTKEASFTLEEA